MEDALKTFCERELASYQLILKDFEAGRRKVGISTRWHIFGQIPRPTEVRVSGSELQNLLRPLLSPRFLGGENLAFVEADALLRELMRANELASAGMVLQRIRIKPIALPVGAVQRDNGLLQFAKSPEAASGSNPCGRS